MKRDKIYLVGFMGSGKSTVARALSRRLGWPATDLDRRIERRTGRAIADIFAEDGEPAFRRLEHEALLALANERPAVVATGGGTFTQSANQNQIRQDGAAIWLDVSFDTAVARIPRDGRRPLAADPDRMRRLWNERQAAYGQAHLRVDANHAGVDELVDQIVAWVENA